jgi:DNA-binding FadR family transcriptional regulator
MKLTDFLSREILDGRLGPGECLPAERDFCQRLGVARSSIREAMSALAREGLIEVRQGQPSRVLSWISEGSFEVFDRVLQIRHGTQNAQDLVQQVLWLRRVMYVGAAELLVGCQIDLLEMQSVIWGIRSAHGCHWPEARYLLQSEEGALCCLVGFANNAALFMLAHGIRRMLSGVLARSGAGEDLPHALERFQALVPAIEARNQGDLARLLDELCRLREPLYLELARRTPDDT